MFAHTISYGHFIFHSCHFAIHPCILPTKLVVVYRSLLTDTCMRESIYRSKADKTWKLCTPHRYPYSQKIINQTAGWLHPLNKTKVSGNPEIGWSMFQYHMLDVEDESVLWFLLRSVCYKECSALCSEWKAEKHCHRFGLQPIILITWLAQNLHRVIWRPAPGWNLRTAAIRDIQEAQFTGLSRRDVVFIFFVFEWTKLMNDDDLQNA